MIEISISRGLAVAHPGFMAGCAERCLDVEVFEPDGAVHETETIPGADPREQAAPGRAGVDSPRRR